MVLLRLSHKRHYCFCLAFFERDGGEPASVLRTLRQSYEEDHVTRNKDLQTNSM